MLHIDVQNSTSCFTKLPELENEIIDTPLMGIEPTTVAYSLTLLYITIHAH